MAGVTVKVEDKQFQRRIGALKRGVVSPAPLMKIWGSIALKSMRYNWEVEGRPKKWKTLSAVTANMPINPKAKNSRRRGYHPILLVTGNLKNLTMRAEERRMLIGANPATRDYAAIQQFGGMAGRGRKVKIPARPFIVLQEEDKEDMRFATQQFFVRIGS